MKDTRAEIKHALEKVVSRKRWFDFQRLAFQLARQRWPDLEATEWFDDGGEDGITVPSTWGDGKKRSLACSLTGTLEKVRKDCRRIQERKLQIDALIFYTPQVVTNLEIEDWQKKIRQDFNHDLYVMPQATILADLEAPENRWLCREYLDLNLSDEPGIEGLIIKARKAALENLDGWKREYGYEPSKYIQLTLKPESGIPTEKENFITVSQICESIRQVRGLILRGPPGAGKTTTLIQIAIQVAEDPSYPIPIIISLPYWASKGQDFFSFLEEEPAFKVAGLSRTDFARLNHSGRLIFLLNGWNEISQSALERGVLSLREMVKSSPATAFIIATRESAVKPPLAQPAAIAVRPLEPDQRRAIVRASNFSNPDILIDTIEQEPALEQITRTPLFLAGVIELAKRAKAIPKSRYGIIEELLRNIETHPDHEFELKSGTCKGLHRNYLSTLASSMCRVGVTSLTEEQAINSISEFNKTVKDKGLITPPPGAGSVLESLIAHHLLLRSEKLGGATVRFTHQQFQEWFAAEWLYERLAEVEESRDQQVSFNFQREIINNPVWEEPLKFLAERLTVATGQEFQAGYANLLVDLAIPLDLVLAAQLARLVQWGNLSDAREKLCSALRDLYARDHHPFKQYALACMLATGSPDFADLLRPLVESDDFQIRRELYRVWEPFPLSCLGEDWRSYINGLPEDKRTELIKELSLRPDSSHQALAKELAEGDSSLKVRTASLELLADSDAFEAFISVLEKMDHTNWPIGVFTGLLESIPEVYLLRIVDKIKSALPALTLPEARCSVLRILNALNDADGLNLMKREIEQDSSIDTVARLLPFIHFSDPEWATEWLGQRMVKGELWDESWLAYLDRASPALQESLGRAATDSELDVNRLRDRMRVLSKINPELTARLLLPEHIEKDAERRRSRLTKESSYDREDILYRTLRELPFGSLVRAALQIEGSIKDTYDVSAILGMLTPASPIAGDLRSVLSPEECDQIRKLIFTWNSHFPPPENDQGGRRAHLTTLLGAIGKPEDSKILEQWIEDDSQRVKQTNSPMRWTNWYAGALARLNCNEAVAILRRLLSDTEYIGEASRALWQIARKDDDKTEKIIFYPDYRGVFEKREIRKRYKNDQVNPQIYELASAIQRGITALLDVEQESPQRNSALYGLGQAAVALANLGDEECIPTVLRCGVPEALEVLVLKGLVLPGNETFAVLDPIITEIETSMPPHNDREWYVAERCLRVLLFTDKPALGVERIRRIPVRILRSYHLRNLVGMLGLGQVPEAARFLAELRRKYDIRNHLDHYMTEYISAIVDTRQPEGRKILIDLLDDLRKGRVPAIRSDRTLSLAEALGRAAKEDKTILNEIQMRCQESGLVEEREPMILILEKLDPKDAGLMACYLLRDEPNFPLLEQVIRVILDAFLDRIQTERPGVYRLRPRPFNDLRKRLMKLSLEDPIRKRSALAALVSVERQRLEWGRPAGEPRHPDINVLPQIKNPWQLLV